MKNRNQNEGISLELKTIRKKTELSRGNITIQDIEELKEDIKEMTNNYDKTFDGPISSIEQSDENDFTKFCKILFHIDKLNLRDKDLTKGFQKLLVQRLKKIKEANWSLYQNQNQVSQKNYALNALYNESLFLSEADKQFCEKWKVTGPNTKYHYWLNLQSNLNYYFDNNYFNKLVLEWTQKFGLQKISKVIDARDTIYDQFINEKASNRYESKANTLISELRPEIDIWNISSLVLLCSEYMKNFALDHDAFDIDKKATAIREQFLTPMLRDFLNPVRSFLKRSVTDESIILSHLQKFYNYPHEKKAPGVVNDILSALPSPLKKSQDTFLNDKPGSNKESLHNDAEEDKAGNGKVKGPVTFPLSTNPNRFQYAKHKTSPPNQTQTSQTQFNFAVRNRN